MLDSQQLFDIAKKKGFSFSGAKEWITEDSRLALASDAALITSANSGVPVELTAFIDPQVIEIMTAARNARKLYGEIKKGDWTTSYERFRVDEFTGSTTPYDDFGNGAVSSVNSTWPTRAQYRFQTTIEYGDLEQELSSVAKMNVASAKQKAAARAIDIDANRFYLYGVSGMEIYGLLNDPNLNAALTPTTAGLWSAKTTVQIYNDIMQMWANLKQNSGGNIDVDADVCLVVSPQSSVQLDKATDFNISVRDMLSRAFEGKLQIIELPELYSATAQTNDVMLVARKVLESPTCQLAFGEKYRAFPVIREMSGFKQKVMATTYGAVVYKPFAVCRMTGI